MAGGVALALSFVGGTSHAVVEMSGEVDLGEMLAPSLGSEVDNWRSGWRHEYEPTDVRVRVSSNGQPGDGLVVSSLTQLQIGDVYARSTVEGMTLYVLPGNGLGGHPIISGSATAIGNLSDITICMMGSCDEEVDVPDGEVVDVEEPDDDGAGSGGGNPGILVVSDVDGRRDGGPLRIIRDTTNTGSEGSSESVAATEEAGEDVEEAESGLNFEIAMAPSLGLNPGSGDWLLHGLGDFLVEIDPSVYLLSRVLVERNQLMIGDVTATSTADNIEVVETEVAEAIVGDESDNEFPGIVLDAVAIGNLASLSSDVGGVAIDRQVVIGSSDGDIVMPEWFGGDEPEAKPMSEALVTMMGGHGLQKAQISAEASAQNFAGALSELSATAVANIHSAGGNTGVEVGSLVGVNLVQLSYADITAISEKGPADITGNLEFSSVATAIANMSTISVPHPFN